MNMHNITVQFKSSLPYSMEGVIDQDTPIKVSSGTSVSLELAPGVHTLRAAIPYRGNEMGTVQAEIEIKPEMQYKILYKFIAMQTRGVLAVKEKRGEGQEIEVAKFSGALTSQGILRQALLIALLIYFIFIFIRYFLY